MQRSSAGERKVPGTWLGVGLGLGLGLGLELRLELAVQRGHLLCEGALRPEDHDLVRVRVGVSGWGWA